MLVTDSPGWGAGGGERAVVGVWAGGWGVVWGLVCGQLAVLQLYLNEAVTGQRHVRQAELPFLSWCPHL